MLTLVMMLRFSLVGPVGASSRAPATVAAIVTIDGCSSDPSFTLRGKKVRVSVKAIGSLLGKAARTVAATGARRVVVTSECKEPTIGLARICSAFEAEGLEVTGVIVPSAAAPGRQLRRCGDSTF